MNREEYRMMARMQSQIPPKQETPEGQKFHIGEVVKISNEKDKDRLYEIQYSYKQKYRGGMPHHINSYSLKHLFEENSSSWYRGDDLELVKGIDEITKERDIAEYKRLKAKYGDL